MELERTIKRIFKDDAKALNQVHKLLEEQGLQFENTVTEIYGMYDGKSLIATGSLFDNVLKMIAVDPEHQGSEVINKLMSHLITQANGQGKTHLFMYTTPLKYKSFEYFGFSKVESTDKVVLMENHPQGLERYLRQIRGNTEPDSGSAAIIVNCNPFTLGHRYLIEEAAKENQKVYAFVLWENLSTFPNEVRYRLVKEGLRDLENVEVHWAKDYIISSATFPSYFLGDHQEVIKHHTELDVKIFGNHIAKTLKIQKRYIGEEPFNPVTRQYNETLKHLLPQFGIEVVELKRKAISDQAISASAVRRFLAEDRWEELRTIVPDTTWAYLTSEEAKPIIDKIKKHHQTEKLV